MKDFFHNYSTCFLAVLFFLFQSNFVHSQNRGEATILTQTDFGYKCKAIIVENDTFPEFDLNTVYITTNYVFKNAYQYEKWTRTKHNVKKVYPYAIIAAAKLKEYDFALEKIEDEHLKKAFVKACEKDLRKEFESELKGLSISQGKILMKLIDREAGKTTYEIVKQLRGSFQAAMWQTVACLFGNTMKVEYDPIEDIMIERAVKLVENGKF